MPVIASMLRVRDEARWIGRVLAALEPLGGPVLVMDDHSQDETAAICRAAGAAVMESPFTGLDESRDKDWLFGKVAEIKPKWVLCIDGDEILSGAQSLLDDVARGQFDSYALRVLYLWDRADQVRVDGVYGRFWRPSLFRFSPDLRFTATGNGGNFHCGNVPRKTLKRAGRSAAQILHLGYMEREDRIRKYRWYNERDPNDKIEDFYRHMVQGDIPEVPAGARLVHAGPLRLETLCAPAS